MSELRSRYEQVCSKLPEHVTLVAVSKTRSVEEIKDLYEIGHREFGENKAQELVVKAPALPDDIIWHFIGHLQRNKVKAVVPHADIIHSVDSVRLLDEINKQAAKLVKVQDVLLQVHIAEEDAKFGLVKSIVPEIIRTSLNEHGAIRIRGLMGMATFTEDNGVIASEFNALKTLFDSIKATFKEELPAFDMLSMGMSGDAGIAVENGSTLVRIGTAIFGKRN